MRISDWYFLCGCMGLCAFMSQALGLFTQQKKPTDLCVSAQNTDNRSSFSHVCQQKMKLYDARVSDIALIEGISVKKARLIIDEIKDKKIASFDELLVIKGVGPKTLVRLQEHFAL